MRPDSNNNSASSRSDRRADSTEPRAESDREDLAHAVAELSHAAWLRSGRPFPSYTRATMPVRIIKRSDDR